MLLQLDVLPVLNLGQYVCCQSSSILTRGEMMLLNLTWFFNFSQSSISKWQIYKAKVIHSTFLFPKCQSRSQKSLSSTAGHNFRTTKTFFKSWDSMRSLTQNSVASLYQYSCWCTGEGVVHAQVLRAAVSGVFLQRWEHEGKITLPWVAGKHAWSRGSVTH